MEFATPTKIIEPNYRTNHNKIISNEDIEKIKDYIKDANDLFNSGTLTKKEYEIVKDLNKPVKSSEELQYKGKDRNDRVK